MGNLSSLFLYIITLSLSAFLYYIYCKKHKTVFLAISFLLPLALCAFRYGVGSDYFTYLNMCEAQNNGNILMSIVSEIARYLGNCRLIFVFYGFFTLYFFYLSLDQVDKKFRPIALLLLLFLYYTVGFNIVKQTLSIAILLFSYKYIEQKKPINYYIFALLATLFHASAMISLLLYPLVVSKKKFSQILSLILFTIVTFNLRSIILRISSIPVFNHFTTYADTANASMGNNYTIVIYISLLFIIILFTKHLEKTNKNNTILITLYAIGTLLSISGFYNPYVKRISLYFLATESLLIPQLVTAFKTPKDRRLIALLIIMLVIIKFTISAYFLKQSSLIPYRIY